MKITEKGEITLPQKRRFLKNYGITISDFKFEIERVQSAAVFLLQFTGMRYSEAASLKVGCIGEIDG